MGLHPLKSAEFVCFRSNVVRTSQESVNTTPFLIRTGMSQIQELKDSFKIILK